MAILYDWYENPGTNEEAPEERGLHPAVAQRESNHAAALQPRACPQLAHGGRRDERDRLPGAICGEELRDGHEVHIEGWATSPPPWKPHRK